MHLAYALVLSFQFDWLIDSSLSFEALIFPEVSVLGDLIIVPAFLYAFLARKRPMQALIGAFSMSALGLFAIRIWFPVEQLSPAATKFLELTRYLSPLLTTFALAAEIAVVLMLWRLLKKPMKEPAIEVLLAPLLIVLGRESKILQFLYAEQRIWMKLLLLRFGICRDQPNSAAETAIKFFISPD